MLESFSFYLLNWLSNLLNNFWRCLWLSLAAVAALYNSGEWSIYWSIASVGECCLISFSFNSILPGEKFVVVFESPIKTYIRCSDARDLLSGESPYWILSFESCVTVLVVLVWTPQYQMLCIVFWLPRKMTSYIHGLRVLEHSPGCFVMIFVPNLLRLSNDKTQSV